MEKNKRTGKQCPFCKKGTTVKRTNKAIGSLFVGCDQFPRCKYSRDWNPGERRKNYGNDGGMDIDECYQDFSGYSGGLNGDF